MDGKNLQEIVKNREVTAMTIDRTSKQVFWYDDQDGIVRADYEGKNRVILMGSHVVTVTSLAYHENYLFFLHPFSYSAGVKHKATLWACKIDKEICKDRKELPIFFHDPKIIKTYVKYSKTNENPCKVNNGDCSDFCLLNSKRGKSCTCRVGYRLSSDDSKNCEVVSDFILYLKSNYLRGMSLKPRRRDYAWNWGILYTEEIEQNDDKNFIIPTPFPTNTSGLDTVHFDYDAQNDNFYFYDQRENEIKVMNIKNESEPEVLISNIGFVNGLGFDYASKHLYYSNNYYLKIYNTKIEFDRVLRTLTKSLNLTGSVIEKFLIVPDQGRIFIISKNDFYSLNTDGSNFKQINHRYGLLNYSGYSFTWDNNNDVFYFINNDEVIVESTDLSYKNKDIFPIKNVKSTSFYDNSLLVHNSSGIWRASVKYRVEVTQIVFTSKNDKILGLKLFKPSKFFDDYLNECELKNNGNCELFCFPRPIKTCACDDNEPFLENDGTCHY